MEEANNLTKAYIDKVREVTKVMPDVIKDVYEIFVESYGEEYVDIQPINDVVMLNSMLTCGVEACINLGIPSNEVYDNITLGANCAFKYVRPEQLRPNEVSYIIDKLFNDYSSIIPVYCIYVKYPTLRITNEHDICHIIHDFYTCTMVTIEGSLTTSAHAVTWLRASYSIKDYNAGYRHSHLKSTEQSLTTFTEPCLGQGPIQTTIIQLQDKYCADYWYLYCKELDLSVHTESLAGGPYFSMSNIGNSAASNTVKYYTNFSIKIGDDVMLVRSAAFKKIMTHILKEHLLNWVVENDIINLGMGFADYMEILSDFIIKLTELPDEGEEIKTYLNKYSFKGYRQVDMIKRVDKVTDAHVRVNDGVLFKFKGKEVKLKLEDANSNQVDDRRVFINYYVAMAIYTRLTTAINIFYGKTNKSGTHKRRLHL